MQGCQSRGGPSASTINPPPSPFLEPKAQCYTLEISFYGYCTDSWSVLVPFTEEAYTEIGGSRAGPGLDIGQERTSQISCPAPPAGYHVGLAFFKYYA